MSCAPGFPLRFQPLERLWRGFKKRNPTARVASGGGFEVRRIIWGLAHKRAEFVFAKIRLEQVRPDSAFWSSEMSMEVTWKPRASMRARVRGNDAGKMIVPDSCRALAA